MGVDKTECIVLHTGVRSPNRPERSKSLQQLSHAKLFFFKSGALLNAFNTVRCTEVRGRVKNRKFHAVHRDRHYVYIRNKGKKVNVTLEQATKDQSER
jgi:hypothetical protein